MFQRDYILRMIEMMGDLARKVAQLMDELEYLHQLDSASRLHCGMPLKALETLSHESLIEMLAPEPRLYASELLYLRGMEQSVHWDERDQILLKSLRLLTSLTEESMLCEIRTQRLMELKGAVAHIMTADDLMASAVFFCEGDCFDEMEDALFLAVESVEDETQRNEMIRLGATMLRLAAHRGEAKLAFCNMTEEELTAAASDLEALAAKQESNER